MNTSGTACCSGTGSKAHPKSPRGWNITYLAAMTILAVFWWLAYSRILPVAHRLVFGLLGMAPESRLGAALEFFIYDTVKILLLLAALIYIIAWMRASLNIERVRDRLAGKRRGLGCFLGALFGSITPFCSCSSIPLFLGFAAARIPMGITMSFLITSPLINEIAVALLWGLLGWKFTAVYVAVGMTAGVIGGFVMDSIRAERWLQPFIMEAMNSAPAPQYVSESGQARKLTIRQRHIFAYGETVSIFRRVWKWVIIGVGAGAALHGLVPENWFAEHLGTGEWWSVHSPLFKCDGHRAGHGKSAGQGPACRNDDGILHERRSGQHPGSDDAAPDYDLQAAGCLHRLPVGDLHPDGLAVQLPRSPYLMSVLLRFRSADAEHSELTGGRSWKSGYSALAAPDARKQNI